MKQLIRKILRESTRIEDTAPDWVKKFHTLSKEERIEDFEIRKNKLKKIIPIIVKYFEEKFGKNLVYISVGQKPVHLGNEGHSTNKILLDFRFSDSTNQDPIILKREVIKDLSSFFNIDIEFYGNPVELEFHKATWEKI